MYEINKRKKKEKIELFFSLDSISFLTFYHGNDAFVNFLPT